MFEHLHNYRKALKRIKRMRRTARIIKGILVIVPLSILCLKLYKKFTVSGKQRNQYREIISSLEDLKTRVEKLEAKLAK